MYFSNVQLHQMLRNILIGTIVVVASGQFSTSSSAIDFLDNFDDGSFEDGSPGQWNGTLLFNESVPATVYAENGAIVLDSMEDDAFIKADLLRIGGTDGLFLESNDTWSIRSQFRIFSEESNGQLAHAGLGTTAFQSAFLTVTGELGVGQGFSLNSVQTDFERITERDFVIQLDVEEDLLTGHVWPLDNPANIFSVEFQDESRLSRPLVFNRRTIAAYDYVQVSSNPPLPFPPSCITGDFDCDGVIGLTDIEALSSAIRTGDRDATFDVSESGIADREDLLYLIRDVKGTWIGDANLDGFFDTGDLVRAFQANQYEDDITKNSNWATGDWNGDAEFDTGDLIFAFQDGGFEAGRRTSPVAVPEPTAIPVLGLAALTILGRRSLQCQHKIM